MSVEQRKRERRMAALNKQQRFAESLKIYLDARCPCNEVWDAYDGLVNDAVEIRACLREAMFLIGVQDEPEVVRRMCALEKRIDEIGKKVKS